MRTICHTISVFIRCVFSASQAYIAILLINLIQVEIHDGKSDKEIYKKLEEDFGKTVLCSPKFVLQTVLEVPLLIAAFAGVRGVPLTPNKKQTMLDLLTLPPSRGMKLRNYGTMVCLLPDQTFFVSIQGRLK
ncbi:cytochrome c-type biogenesis CcmH-like mitochondrial protein [Prunus yedoensis var. nudiflora]|uniref:Cytochrome c-type biogenesis protein n=1 Tax=Prunus yedoensis var. nudiflora TaxID=2094558 RepID=A0A315ADB9_PRUYE|nr:cytochrome c-type biogenesis CcmH-like mitochondrial protein [Prunus yedoensis var. nudiflora]